MSSVTGPPTIRLVRSRGGACPSGSKAQAGREPAVPGCLLLLVVLPGPPERGKSGVESGEGLLDASRVIQGNAGRAERGVGMRGSFFWTHPGSSGVMRGARKPVMLEAIAVQVGRDRRCGPDGAGPISIQSRPTWTGTPAARRFSAHASSRSHSSTRVL